ncbi:hypothetical protein C8J56DRAFT_1157604 [Mycena floridula]|nr:hypothetical protein C8J56DRAFT_1157604 [Mycena floridula]
MKLKEIHRTSTFAWSPSASLPMLATGTVAGALDESFSDESQLEIWAPDFLDKDEYDLGGPGEHGPKGLVTDKARFNRLTWGYVDEGRPHGVLAAGMENGELSLWDPAQILAGSSSEKSLILRAAKHAGPVRGLDFNPIQNHLLASGATGGEVFIWDLKEPGKTYSPTGAARSTKLEEITSLAWNQQVQSVLAGASSTGYTVVYDLRGKREVVALAYGGGAGTLAGQTSGSGLGGRRGMSDIAWHPDNATRLVTASEDDSSPIIMMWDLRNSRAPEKILTGHEKGVLSLSWCKQDADLLLSCGKDNRALCWNPQTSEVIGELPSADNWAFQVDWCPRNPDLLATAFFDGTIGIHSIQTTNEATTDTSESAPSADGADIFNVPGFTRSSQGTLSLKQPPKWLRRPISSSFGFGGKLISVSNLPSAQGKNQSSVVHVRKVVTEDEFVERASKLQAAIDGDSLKAFAEEKSAAGTGGSKGIESWKALRSVFQADSRDELVTLLGFSKAEIATKVAEAVEKLKVSGASLDNLPYEDDSNTDIRVSEPVVSFAEPEREKTPSETSDTEDAAPEKTPSETSLGVSSDTTSARRQTDGESNTTVPSLFGDDGPGTPQDAGADFFSSMVSQHDGMTVPHTNYGIDSSVAATIGSGPSSVTSETTKNTFRIHPGDESEVESLVTKALVLGDFDSAVSLCLSSDRYADAILLAVRGGPELLARTQKAYFERRTSTSPYLRLFQSIVTNDLSDIVQNADLQEWQEIFVVLCTFASKEDFSGLAEQLGNRLEFQFSVEKSSDDAETVAKADEFRKYATLTYLAAGRLERLVNIWGEEMVEEEEHLVADESRVNDSRYSTHAQVLQTFIEKVTVFRYATKYVDAALSAQSDIHKLAVLYDRYLEYSELLASQGKVKEAVAFLTLTPESYKGSDEGVKRERLRAATKATPAPAPAPAPAAKAHGAPAAKPYGQPSYPATYPAAPAPVVSPVHPASNGYSNFSLANQPTNPSYTPANPTSYQPATNPSYQPATNPSYQPATNPSYQPATNTSYAPANPQNQNQFTNGPNSSYNSLTQPPHLRQQHATPVAAMIPPPPPPGGRGTPGPRAPAGPPKPVEGWNDAPPVVKPPSRGPSALNLHKPSAITSPFPNSISSPVMSPPAPYSSGVHSGYISPGPPPPGRPGSRAAVPPPPGPGQSQQPASGASNMGPNRPGPGPGPGPGFAPQLQQHQQQSHFGPGPGPQQSQFAQPTRGPPGPPGRPPSVAGGGFARPPQGPGAPGGSYYAPGAPGAGPAQSQPGPYGPPSGGQPGPQGQGQTYGPGPGQAQSQPGPYGPPAVQRPVQSNPGSAPPPGPGPPAGPGPAPMIAPSRLANIPVAPKYPPGDRSHIPEKALPAFSLISEQLNQIKQTTPPNQKRVVEDLQRRIDPLFDALNCETLSEGVVDQLLVLTQAMAARDRPAALAIHVDLLTKGSLTDDIGIWMSGLKQLILRM